MEIKGTTLNETLGNHPGAPRIGSMLRVRVLKRINARHVLVHFNRKNHLARITGSIPSDFFIAQVQKLGPRLQLRFIRDLVGKNQPLNNKVLSKILNGKKSFIQKLFTSDNLGEALSVLVKEDRREIRASLQRSISQRNIVPSLNRAKGVTEYLLLESLHNFMSSESFYILLPLIVERRRYMAELRMVGNRENAGHGISFNIEVDSETSIAFVVYLDYETIHCTLSTNNPVIEGVLRDNIHMLSGGLRSLKYTREVHIRFVPYNQCDHSFPGSFKKIDVKM
jgi:hypothetical protein